MKLAILSNGSPFDINSFSGTPYFALKELSARHEVHVIDTPKLDKWISRARRLNRFGILPPRTPLAAAVYKRLVTRRVEELKPDAIVCIQAATKILSLVGQWPCLLVADAMVGPLLDYYPSFAKVSRRGRMLANDQERIVIDSKSSIVLSSDWAARSSAEFYKVPLSRFVIAPLGANIAFDPPVLPPARREPLRLLFVGYDWIRKGGPLVLEAFERLKQTVANAELHLVGCSPAEAVGVAGVTIHGKLNKQDADQREKLFRLFSESSFMFMPTRYEAFGLVFCEACAFSLPPVAGDTGGVGTIIRNGENGLLLPYDAAPDDYAKAILAVWSDPDRYADMRAKARSDFESRLSWKAWGRTMDSELERIANA